MTIYGHFKTNYRFMLRAKCPLKKTKLLDLDLNSIEDMFETWSDLCVPVCYLG